MGAVIVEVLIESFMSQMSYDELIDEDHETPSWLKEPAPSEIPNAAESGAEMRYAPNSSGGERLLLIWRMKQICFLPILGLPWLTLGIALIIFITWGCTTGEKTISDVRWWWVYIPIDADITGYINSGVFIMLGFG